jgi:hypothetical protein
LINLAVATLGKQLPGSIAPLVACLGEERTVTRSLQGRLAYHANSLVDKVSAQDMDGAIV